jgi:hypothetical protein
VPEPEEPQVTRVPDIQESSETATTRHTEIQYRLLTLGGELGLDVWVARNDRNRRWNGVTVGSLPKMLDQLPTQFNDATTRTIELIDVLWLTGNSPGTGAFGPVPSKFQGLAHSDGCGGQI